MKSFDKFDELLGKIGASTETNTNWKDLGELFLYILCQTEKEDPLKAYKAGHEFLTKIYGTRNQDRLIKLAIQRIQTISGEGRKEDTKLADWILLDCL